jgi:hypothetical protein
MIAAMSLRAPATAAGTPASSAAKDFTTRTPSVFSCTTPATTAARDWMIHDDGNSALRIRTPDRYTNGSVTIATHASRGCFNYFPPHATE